MTLQDRIRQQIELRPHNGQCGYGTWMRLTAYLDSLQQAIEDDATDEYGEFLADSGHCSAQGHEWDWRRV